MNRSVLGSKELKNYLDNLCEQCAQPPLLPRFPLFIGTKQVGSVQENIARLWVTEDFFQQKEEQLFLAQEGATAVLQQAALWLQAQGLAAKWRDEQLAVTDENGYICATVERAVVRTLGITTVVVHLFAVAADGRIWLQRRALNKATDPGKLDTLAGGLVAAYEPLDEALKRETWEEAGIQWAQMVQVHTGDTLLVQCSIDETIGGYMVEKCHWSIAHLHEGVVPSNQDGEVSEFVLLTPEEVAQAVLNDQCAAEAAFIFARALNI